MDINGAVSRENGLSDLNLDILCSKKLKCAIDLVTVARILRM